MFPNIFLCAALDLRSFAGAGGAFFNWCLTLRAENRGAIGWGFCFPHLLCLQVSRSAAGDKESDLDSELGKAEVAVVAKKVRFNKSFYEFNLFFTIFQMRRLAGDCKRWIRGVVLRVSYLINFGCCRSCNLQALFCCNCGAVTRSVYLIRLQFLNLRIDVDQGVVRGRFPVS